MGRTTAVPSLEPPIDIDPTSGTVVHFTDRVRRELAAARPVPSMASTKPAKLPPQTARAVARIEARTQAVRAVARATQQTRNALHEEITTELFAELRLLAAQEQALDDLPPEFGEQWAVMKSNLFTYTMGDLERANQELDRLADAAYAQLAEMEDFAFEEWTWKDDFIQGFTFNQHRLDRRGIPYTVKDEIKNLLTGGWWLSVVERQHDAALKAAQQSQEVIDVTGTVR